MKRFAFVLFLHATLAAISPPPLQKGDLIALVFPASFLDSGSSEGQAILNRKAKWLQKKGYNTIFYPGCVKPRGYLAGSDQERARALMGAWKNPKVKAIWCVRGGYGTPRLLDLLDYDWIRSHPKILIGMSDITALHQAIIKKTDLTTYLGPVFNYFDEGSSDFDSKYAFEEFEKVLSKEYPGPIELPKGNPELVAIRPGKAHGKLVGGNLTLLAALTGTKWQLDTADKVLILEDVNEEIFRIDRMLWQLKEAGCFDKPAAVILGSWKDCRSNLKNSLKLDEVFQQYFGEAKFPVIKNFPSGHGKYQTTLALNAVTEVDADELVVRQILK